MKIKLLFIMLLLSMFSWGQTNITPTRSTVSGFPTWTDVDVAGSNYIQLLKATSTTVTPAMDFNAYTNETLDFTARTFGGTTAAEIILTVSISTNNGGNWTVIGTRTPSTNGLLSQAQFDISSYSGTQVRIKFSVAGIDNTIGVGIAAINIQGNIPTCTPPANPVGTISGTTPACASTTLTYTGTDATTAYWQATATGTSIAEPANSTKTVSSSGTYYVRNYNTATSCWSNTTVSKAVVINSPINITTQPLDKSIIAGTNTTFNVVASNVVSYQWQVDTGSGFNNLTNGAPYSNVTTANLGITNATFAMSGYKYRCVLTANSPCSNTNTNGFATLTVTNASPNNVGNLTACIANDQITLKWTAATGSPTGYIVFVQPNTTIPQMAATTAGNASGYNVNTNYATATSYTTLGKAVYKGNALTTTITGLSNTSQYTFKVVAYTGETGTGWANGIANTSTSSTYIQTYTVDVPEITSLTASIAPTSATVTWNVVPSSVGCYEYMVVANSGSVSLIPTGNGTAYTANTTLLGSNQVVYKGTGNSVVVTGLSEDVNYCYKVFVREINSGSQWSEGTSVCQTTGLIYCLNASNNSSENGITNVILNNISNPSTATPSYTDFTSINTILYRGESFGLSVNVKTHASTTSYIKVWFDWNRNGSFESGEDYDLGTAVNVTNGLTTNSPLNIIVPTNATIGNIRMRIISRQDSAPTACTSFNYGEVEDYTINVEQPVNPEINVKGGAISIPNGFDDPNGLNNTQFATIPLNVDSAEKSFTIENLGIANLILAGPLTIKLEGNNPSDFIVTQQATTPVVNGAPVTFKIKFHPTVAGLRTANVRIESNDSDENPYIFAIEGRGECTVAPSINVFPIAGPRNTLVTFSSASSDLTGAIITYNNVSVPVISNTNDRLEVLIPVNANDGNFIIQLANGCSKTQAFDVLDTDLSSCQGSGGSGGTNYASDLIIYEVYDENGGSGGVVTLYNRTGATVNLSTYSIKRAGDYGGNYVTYSNLSGNVADGAVAVIGVSSSLCGYTPTGNGSFGSGFNGNDGIRLMKGTTIIDDFHAPNYLGYYLKRKNTNLNPNLVYNYSEWTTQSLSKDECLPGIVTPPIIKTPPTVTLQPTYLVNCGITSTTLSVAGSEGFSGGLSLAYQWYALGTSGNWTAITNTGVYSGATTTTLNISNITGIEDYQYYCQIRENTATCFTATNTTLVRIPKKTWNGTTWSGDGLPPTSSEKAIINGELTLPNADGSTLEACECQVNAGGKLTVGNVNGSDTGTATVIIQGDLNNNGVVIINNNSSLVQVNDEAINIGNISVNRIAQVKRYDYVYWSSPVKDFPINSIPDSHRYEWDTTVGNPKGTQGNWIDPTTINMTKGKGYIVRSSTGDATQSDLSVIFKGIPFNGKFNFFIKRGSILASDNDNYNLIGNPYPSAIDVGEFLFENADPNGPNPVLEGAVHIWSHGTLPSAIASPFYQDFTYNYNSNDYIVYNSTGSISGPGTFLGKIASGQGFFVKMIDGAADNSKFVTFKNSMRSKTYKNNNFYKIANSNKEENKNEKHRIWLDLFKTDGGSSRTLIGYLKGATYDKDVMYDAFIEPEDLSIYSLTGKNLLSIQGRPLPFDENDKVSLGINVLQDGKYVIAVGFVDGLFDSKNQNIYLEDKLLGSFHDLKSTPYEFTSLKGKFEDRFVLRYNQNKLNTDDFSIANELVITTNESQITIFSKSEAFNHVKIYDLLGRKIYDKKDMNSNLYNIPNLVQDQVLIVKVKLNNGNEVSNKIIVK